MRLQIGDTVYAGWQGDLAIAIFALAALALLLSIGIFVMWIKYSWIERHNSKNWTGRDITEWIFKKEGMVPVEIQSSFFYLKYWNYNQKRGTYKLKPWTHDRQSLWTLMEASQQAYASTIRATKGATFWLLFRIPGVLRGVGVIAGAVLIYLGLKDVADNSFDWVLIGFGFSVIVLAYVAADLGRVWIIWKNVGRILKDSGLQEYELKAINRIYFWRMIYALVIVILELIKLAFRIAEAYGNKRK